MSTVRLRVPAALLCAALVLVGCTTPELRDTPDRPSTSAARPAGGKAEAGGATRIVLTPTATPESSQAFGWLADEEGDTALLQIEPTNGGDGAQEYDAAARGAINGNSTQHFSATVTGLSPGTDYRYRVGAPDAWSDWFTFTTADPSQTAFSFLYFGDAQVGLDTTWPKVAAAAAAASPESVAVVAAGDLVNDADEDQQWEDWTTGLGDLAASRNIFAVPGNHEYLGDDLLTAWRSTFELPRNGPTRENIGSLADLAVGEDEVSAQYAAFFDRFTEMAMENVYYTDYQGVRFVSLDGTRNQLSLTPADLPTCVDPDCPASFPGEVWMQFQAAWLDGVLAESEATWDVVSIHQPIYSSAVGFDEPAVREQFLPVLEDRGADLLLMGHDHVYARGYTDSDATDTAGLTSGPVFVTSNAGAQNLDLETDPAKNVWTANGATQVRTGQGISTYQTIDVTPETLRYRSWIVEKKDDSDVSAGPGDLFDEFTITRRDDGQTWVTEPGVTAPG